MSHRNSLGVNEVCSERQRWETGLPAWAGQHIGFIQFRLTDKLA